ncbi:MAG TPA: hypothetical protein ENG98_04880 [Actinobacteria bacterium]|nr:hypothetical protein [Actinomycetota bacterium]
MTELGREFGSLPGGGPNTTLEGQPLPPRHDIDAGTEIDGEEDVHRHHRTRATDPPIRFSKADTVDIAKEQPMVASNPFSLLEIAPEPLASVVATLGRHEPNTRNHLTAALN